MSELRQRYIQDLRLRNYSPRTVETYVHCVSLFARYFNRSPEELGPEHIRTYQLYLVEEKKCSWSRINQTVCALRFLYRNTLAKDWAITHIPFPRKVKKLPVVLSRDEAAQFLAAIKSLKYRTILSLCYGAGLRISEVLNLHVADIDSSRMMIRIRQAKGNKDRYVMLSPRLLDLLRLYWKAERPATWLFPRPGNNQPLGPSVVQKVFSLPASLNASPRPLDSIACSRKPARRSGSSMRRSRLVDLSSCSIISAATRTGLRSRIIVCSGSKMGESLSIGRTIVTVIRRRR